MTTVGCGERWGWPRHSGYLDYLRMTRDFTAPAVVAAIPTVEVAHSMVIATDTDARAIEVARCQAKDPPGVLLDRSVRVMGVGWWCRGG